MDNYQAALFLLEGQLAELRRLLSFAFFLGLLALGYIICIRSVEI
jgi:hypothetical protein